MRGPANLVNTGVQSLFNGQAPFVPTNTVVQPVRRMSPGRARPYVVGRPRSRSPSPRSPSPKRKSEQVLMLEAKVKELEDKVKKYKMKVKELKYAPGGMEYQKAKQRFQEGVTKQLGRKISPKKSVKKSKAKSM
jgi:hypothetical protein